MKILHLIVFSCLLGNILGEVLSDTRTLRERNAQLAALKTKYGDHFKQSNSCGGILNGPAGLINYKQFKRLFKSGEGCVWTILVPHKETIQVRLIDDGFKSECVGCQTITILKVNGTQPRRKEFVKHDEITEHPDRKFRNITGSSLIQIVFTALTQENNESGFSLSFEGIGKDINGTTNDQPNYVIYESNVDGETEGLVEYQSNVTSETFDLVLFTLNPPKESKIAITLEKIGDPYEQTRRYGCSDYTLGSFIVSNLGLPFAMPTTRLRECYPSDYNTTIISQVPLQVFFLCWSGHGQSFQFIWRIFDK